MKRILFLLQFIIFLQFLTFTVFAETIAKTPEPPTPPTQTTVVSDDDIIDKAKQALTNSKMLNGVTIDIASKNGNVTITGIVTTQAQSDEIVRLVKTVYGVKQVKTDIIVRATRSGNLIVNPAPTPDNTPPTVITQQPPATNPAQ